MSSSWTPRGFSLPTVICSSLWSVHCRFNSHILLAAQALGSPQHYSLHPDEVTSSYANVTQFKTLWNASSKALISIKDSKCIQEAFHNHLKGYHEMSSCSDFWRNVSRRNRLSNSCAAAEVAAVTAAIRCRKAARAPASGGECFASVRAEVLLEFIWALLFISLSIETQ